MLTKKVDPAYPSMAPLDQAALDTVRQWEYTPTVLDGVR